MQSKKLQKFTGVAIAMAAAAMLSGCQSPPSHSGSMGGGEMAGGSTDLAHCYGVNKCSGHNDCKGSGNACAGKAACKGMGFVTMPAKACANVGGTVKDSWHGSVAKADLSHCVGVNKCGGHNDCKGAGNACAGKASCKGHGFVAMPAKACSDIGGELG